MAFTIDKIGRAQTRLLESKKSELETRQNDPRRGRPEERLSGPDRALLEAIKQELERRVRQQQDATRERVDSALQNADSQSHTDVLSETELPETRRESLYYLLLAAHTHVQSAQAPADIRSFSQRIKAKMNSDIGTGLLAAEKQITEVFGNHFGELQNIFRSVQVERSAQGTTVDFAKHYQPALSSIVAGLAECIDRSLHEPAVALPTPEKTALLLTLGAVLEQKINQLLQPNPRVPEIAGFIGYITKELLVKFTANIADTFALAEKIRGQRKQEMTGRLEEDKRQKLIRSLELTKLHAGILSIESAQLKVMDDEIIHAAEVLRDFPHRSLKIVDERRKTILVGTYVWSGNRNGRIGLTADTHDIALKSATRQFYLIITPSDIHANTIVHMGSPLCIPGTCMQQALTIRRETPRMMRQIEEMMKILCPSWQEQVELLQSCFLVEEGDHLHVLYPRAKGKPQFPESTDLDRTAIASLRMLVGMSEEHIANFDAIRIPSLKALERRLLHPSMVDGRYIAHEEPEEEHVHPTPTGREETRTEARRSTVPRTACMHKVLLQKRMSAQFTWDTDGTDQNDPDYTTAERNHPVIVTLPELNLQFVMTDDPSMSANFTRCPYPAGEYIGKINSASLRGTFGCRPIDWHSDEQFSRALATLIEDQQRHRRGMTGSDAIPDLLQDRTALAEIGSDIEQVAQKLGKQPWEVTMQDMRHVRSGTISWRWLDMVHCGDTYLDRMRDGVRTRLAQLNLGEERSPAVLRRHTWQIVLHTLYPTQVAAPASDQQNPDGTS